MIGVSIVENYLAFVQRFGLRHGTELFASIARGEPSLLEVEDRNVSFVTVNDVAQRYHLLESTDKLEEMVNTIPLEPNEVSTVLDVGANVGLFTLFAKAAFPNAEIRAVEPYPSCIEALRANCGGLSDVHIVPKAVTPDRRDTVELHVVPDSNQVGSISVEAATLDGRRSSIPIDVEATTLPEVVSDWDSIDICKLDIQGLEYEILSAAPSLLDDINVCITESSFIDTHTVDLLNLMTEHFESYKPVADVRYGADLLWTG